MNALAVACLALGWGSLMATTAPAAVFYVSPAGGDTNPGTRARPFATPQRAQQAVRKLAGRKPVTVFLRGGTYYLPDTLTFTAPDSGTKAAPVVYQAYKNEQPVLSGGVRLHPQWEPYKNGILKTAVPGGFTTDQLFVNGERQVLARYPNFDPNQPIFNGYAADAFSPERAARWADPRGGFLHAMHQALWGDFSYVITGKDAQGNLTYQGGWQNNRPAPMHDQYRFVEGIFEELDAPHEWFLDARRHTLYFDPPAGFDPGTAMVEGVRLRRLVEFDGTDTKPVRFVTLKGLTFRHALRTFMLTKEPLLRSDWAIYRGGAVFFHGAEDCSLEDSVIDQVGGNAVFVSGYNRRVTIRGCHIDRAGANGVAFVGDRTAVRSPNYWDGQGPPRHFADIDKTPGPKTDDYPADCLVDDCLIHATGRVEKQTAPIEIDMADSITVRHCSLYDVPRAGINIGDGCWGGHVIEYCDIFDTVEETGDHGSFNSWGRDRYWGLSDLDPNTVRLGPDRDLPLLDVVKPITLRNNRWRCDHGWDIDLDDGSSNYHIYNNLCLNGGIKNREGFHRVVENNILVDNTFHAHVWFRDSEDVFAHNIVFAPYRPIGMTAPWGADVDDNLLDKPGQTSPTPAVALQGQSGRDAHSVVADALFVDPAHGDYRVRPGSPALALGFRNFPMDQFGVQKPSLRALARTPKLPGALEAASATLVSQRDVRVVPWLGAEIRNVAGLGEVSAAGLPGEIGVRVEDAPAQSRAAQAGLKPGDVILKCQGTTTDALPDFLAAWRAAVPGSTVTLDIRRDQKNQRVQVRK